MEWIKSSFCNTDQATGNCVEVGAASNGDVVLRDVDDDVVRYTSAEFKAFVAGVKAGEFDHLI